MLYQCKLHIHWPLLNSLHLSFQKHGGSALLPDIAAARERSVQSSAPQFTVDLNEQRPVWHCTALQGKEQRVADNDEAVLEFTS